MRIQECDYLEACEAYQGFCTTCESFTRECTEPDAEGYDCPECCEHTVMGAEQALLLDLLEIEQ